jgi:hypothetical protein
MADPPSGRVPVDEASGEMHQQRLSIAFAVALNEDQSLAERDQTIADAEQTLSDADQAAADIDEAAAENDRAAVDLEVLDGAGDSGYVDPDTDAFPSELRDRGEQQRRRAARLRADVAAARDTSAHARDRIATDREQVAAQREHELVEFGR